MLTIGSLFSGYGGLDLAVESVLDARTAWVADIDPGACKILAHRYPDVPNLGDVTGIDWAAVEPVDIITGGSPCQDLSHAGRRAGMAEGTRSNLWVAMREAIAHLRPQLVIWENVRGALSASADSGLESCPGCMGDPGDRGPALRALGRVLGDLAELGYDAEWHSLRAADIGACHGRFRVFVAATHTASDPRRLPHRDGGAATNAASVGRERIRDARLGWPGPAHGSSRAVDLLPTPDASAHKYRLQGDSQQSHSLAAIAARGDLQLLPTPSVADALGGHERRGGKRGDELLLKGIARHESWGKYAAAIARHEQAFGRTAPAPTEPGPKGNPRLSAEFVEWMMGLSAGWVTDTPGITRNEALKALGNGVVPAQAAAALHTMLNRIEAA